LKSKESFEMRKVLLLSFLFLSCLENEETESPSFFFWLVLVEGQSKQVAFLDKVYSPEEEAGKGVSMAKVFVFSEDTAIEFEEEEKDSSIYYIAEDSSWLRPSHEYSLLVVTPSEDTILGKTSIPGDFQIVSPKEGDTINLPTSNTLIWTSSEGAKLYVIYVVDMSSIEEDTSYQLYFSSDTSADLFSVGDFFPHEGSYLIQVRAENEETYFWNLDHISNLEGATGLFGGMVKREINLYIKYR